MTKIWKHRRVIGLILALIMMFQIEFPVGVTAASDSGSNTELSSGAPAVQDEEEDSGDTGEETTPGIEDADQGDDSKIPAGSEGEDGTEEPGTSEEGEDGAEEPGTPEEGEDGAEEPGTPEEGEGGTEEPGASEEGIEEPETEKTGNVDPTPVISEDTAALLAEFIEMLDTLPTADGSLNQEEYDQVVAAYNKYSTACTAFMTDNADGSFDFDEYLLSTYEGTVENFYALLATPMTTDEPMKVEEGDTNGLQLPTSLSQGLGNVLPGQDRNIKVHLFDYGTAINPSYIYDGVLKSSDTRVLEFADEQPSPLDGKQTNTSSNIPIMSSSLYEGYPYVESYEGRTSVTIDGAKSQPIKNENKENITSNKRRGSLQYLFDEGKDFVDANGNNYPGVTYNPVTGQYDGTLGNSVETLTGTEKFSNFKSQHYEVINNDAGSTGLFRQIGNYLQFDSKDNFAWYNPENKLFELYDFALRPYGGAAAKRARGHFLPFNSNLSGTTQVTDKDKKILEYNRDAVNLGNEDDFNAVTEKIANVWALPNEEKKISPNTPDRSQMANYWYGMSVEFEFYMPAGGMVGDEQMVFQFLGDDDVWVYIDGRLVLDMGKSNGEDIGTINFATGIIEGSNDEASYTDESNKTVTVAKRVSLEQCFTENGEIVKKSDGKPLAKFQELENDNSTFADYSTHTLKFFYLERGGGSCNCRLRFNMPTLPNNSLIVTKKLTTSDVSGSEVKKYVENSVPYTFRVVKVDENGSATDELFIPAKTTYTILENGVSVGRGETDREGRFTIKANQSALFEKMLEYGNGETKCIVEEILTKNINGQYEGVEYSVGSQGGTVQTVGGETQGDFTTYQSGVVDLQAGVTEGEEAEGTTQLVTFKNRVDTTQLSTLKIKKEVQAGSKIEKGTEFKMKVTLGGEPLSEGTQYKVGSETKSVDENGHIVIKDGETAEILSGILSGTEYEVIEMDTDTNKYRTTYRGTETISENTNSIDYGVEKAKGTITKNSSVLVTVTNATYDFAGEIPITKQYLGNTNDKEVFQFNIVQIDEKGNEIPDIQLPGTSITVTNDSVTEGKLVIGYSSDITNDSYFYKITEEKGTGDILYDESSYIVEMKVSDESGTKTASIASIKKDGVEYQKEELEFVNRKMLAVKISKTVTGNLGDQSRAFPFSLSVKIGDAVYIESLEYGKNNVWSTLNSSNSLYTFDLAHGEFVVVRLPYGCNYSLTEDVTNLNYDYTSVKVNGGEACITNNPSKVTTNTGSLIAAENVFYENHKEEIPDTGISLDSMPYILVLALAVIGVAIFIIFKRKRRDDD